MDFTQVYLFVDQYRENINKNSWTIIVKVAGDKKKKNKKINALLIKSFTVHKT